MADERRKRRDMPYRRREEGLTPHDIFREKKTLHIILSLLQLIALLPFGLLKIVALGTVTGLIRELIAVRKMTLDALDPINPANKKQNN
jgi:hypothetical protein